MEIGDSFKNLADALGSIFFGEFALIANAIEQLSTRSQLGNDVILVLLQDSSIDDGPIDLAVVPHTLDSNQSRKLTMCGWLRRWSRSSSS
jgi:hypothetical protein